MRSLLVAGFAACVMGAADCHAEALTYPIVDTGQVRCYSDAAEIRYPAKGETFSGQDAQFSSHRPGYYYAWYVAFGYAVDQEANDRHGAGAVRFDAKTKDGALVEGAGERVNNFVRCVRGGTAVPKTKGPAIEEAVASTGNRHEGERPGMGMPPRGGVEGGPGRGPGGGPGGRGAPDASFVQRLDKDGDDNVSRQEFDGPPEHFRMFDQNRDGYLTQSEAPPPPPHLGRHHGGRPDVEKTSRREEDDGRL